ncbi:MAG: AraC family transcriptional regulator, partial [Mesorhizobium sp.]
MRQPLRYPWPFDPDDVLAPAIAVRVDVTETRAEVPDHH